MLRITLARQWEKWCSDELELSKVSVSYYETMAENLFTIGERIRSKLPASWRSLYQLAVILRDEPEIFHQAIADGSVR